MTGQEKGDLSIKVTA